KFLRACCWHPYQPRGSGKRRLIESASDDDYGNWPKKARSYTSLLFNASRWLIKNTTVIRGDQHIGSSKQMVFECIWLSRGKARWCSFVTGFQNRGIPGVTSFQHWRQPVSA